jgi:cytochrome c
MSLKIFQYLFIILFAFSCSSQRKSITEAMLIANKEELEIGQQMISKSDCFTCHSSARKSVGPAFQEIANRYILTQTNIDRLSKKIINGGSGEWGRIFMTPHPDLSQNDAEIVVKYVLSIKK